MGTDTLSFPKSSSSSSGTRNSWTIWFGTSSGASAVRVSDGVHSILRSMERARRVSARTRAPSAPASSTTTTGRGRVPREQPAGRRHAKAGQRERWPTATSSAMPRASSARRPACSRARASACATSSPTDARTRARLPTATHSAVNCFAEVLFNRRFAIVRRRSGCEPGVLRRDRATARGRHGAQAEHGGTASREGLRAGSRKSQGSLGGVPFYPVAGTPGAISATILGVLSKKRKQGPIERQKL